MSTQEEWVNQSSLEELVSLHMLLVVVILVILVAVYTWMAEWLGTKCWVVMMASWRQTWAESSTTHDLIHP